MCPTALCLPWQAGPSCRMLRCPPSKIPHAAGKAGAVAVKEGRGGLPTVVLQSSAGATAEVRRR